MTTTDRATQLWDTLANYRQAAQTLWGPAGAFAVDEFDRLNREVYNRELPPLPIVIGITAYGKCLGVTRPDGTGGHEEPPRITLSQTIFNTGGPRQVSDVLVHEMLHALLVLRGECPHHNADPWCRMLGTLSPRVACRQVRAAPVKSRRVPNPDRETDPTAPKTKVVKVPLPGHMARIDLATWPHSIRPAGYYADDRPIYVPTY